MLKVCGVTFDHTTNYGSCLQAYALKTAIENLNVGKNQPCTYDLLQTRRIRLDRQNANYQSTMKKRIGLLIHRAFVFPVRLRFQSFEKMHMRYADCVHLNDLPSLNKIYDAFVCGSDVIWNEQYSYGTEIFFLDFATKYKFSYAVSFGHMPITDKEIEICRKNLPRFNAISVREISAVKALENQVGAKARLVCDPCLLLNEKQWGNIYDHKINEQTKPYIFVYTTHESNVLKQTIQKLSLRTGLDVIKSNWRVGTILDDIKTLIKRCYTPQKWVQLIQGAEYVITNSFHATLFAILFHKKFYTVVNGEKSKGINVRMYDFLNLLGLPERLINSIEEHIDIEEIDYSYADQVIDQLRKDGIAYLQENLEAAYAEKCKVITVRDM